MGGEQNAAELTVIEDLLRAQWLRLRTWVGGLDEAAREQPSVLAGWTVADLVAHLGRAMEGLAAAQPAPAGTVPLTLGEYLGQYADRAAEVADATREVAARIADDPLGSVDRTAEAAFAKVQVLRDLHPDPVVQARRGPILLSEMLLSRLVELVVHGDDLLRSTGRSGAPFGEGPLDDAAVRRVAETLLEVAVDRGGWSLEVVEPLTWIRLACGRVPYDVDVLAAALQPVHTGDSVPDLGRALPLM